MTGALVIGLLLLTAAFPSETDQQFRQRMDAYVSEGTRQYMRSNRAGIMAMSDSIALSLDRRSRSRQLLPVDSLEYTADRYRLLGDWHYENSNYEETSYPRAEEYFRSALGIYETSDRFRYDLDKIPLIQRELAQLYYKQGRYAHALSQLESAYQAYAAEYENLFFDGDPQWYTYLDLQMQMALCRARLGQFDRAESLADSLLTCFPTGSERFYETQRKKGKIILLSGSDGREKRALPLYRSYFDWRKEDALKVLASMTPEERQDYWMRMRPFVTDCYQLEGEDPGFLYDVALFSKGLLLQMNGLERRESIDGVLASLRLGWRDVQNRLPSDGCSIEFIQYEKDGQMHMGALVLRKKGSPVWVRMMDPEAFMDYKVNGRPNRSRLFARNGKDRNDLYRDEELRSLLWSKELCSAIGSARRVYFSPDGFLHLLGIEYMPPRQLNGKDFYRLSSSRELTRTEEVHLDSALVVACSRFEALRPSVEKDNDALAYQFIRGQRLSFASLNHSFEEAHAIERARNCPSDTLVLGSAATEPMIRSLLGRYPLAHMSTHGFFCAAEIPQGTDLKPSLQDESLSQCILALSGANTTVRDAAFDSSFQDDLLSAAEVASLDLSGLDLAVLSACQTGLGMITSDGVFGIQRGFKLAGARTLLVSLWSVNDKATALLLSNFHHYLAEGLSTHDAFMRARKDLTSKQKVKRMVRRFNPATLSDETVMEEDDFDFPEFTDAFILIDSIQ